MQMWTRMAIGIGAIGLAIAAGTGAYAMRGDDPKPAVSQDEAGNPSGDDAGGGLGIEAACLEGAPDCNDTPDIPYGDFGETQAKCAAEATDCYQPGCAADTCDGGGFAPCQLTEPDVTDPAVLCPSPIDCTIIAPFPGEVVDPISDDGAPNPELRDPIEDGVPPEGGRVEGGDPFIGTGCLGSDPCTISSRPDPRCLPPDCVSYEDNTVVCPVSCAASVPLGAPDGIASSDCPPPVVCVEPVPGDDGVRSDCVYPCTLEPSPRDAEGVADCSAVPPPFPCPIEDGGSDPSGSQEPECVAPVEPQPDAESR